MTRVLIRLDDPDLEPDRLQASTELLLQQLREVDEIEEAHLAGSDDLPKGSKSIGGFLIGVLTAEVNLENARNLANFLGEFLFRQRIIEIEVEANSRKLKVKASNKQELVAAIEAAKDFISS